MAHMIETTSDGVASFAYSQQIGTAWHRLGRPMDGLSTIDEILVAARADYDVSVHPIEVQDPDDPTRMMETDRAFTMRRRPIVIDDDGVSGGDNHVLGIVGKGYPVFQNREVLEATLRLLATPEWQAMYGDIDSAKFIDCAGVLRDGKEFFATIPLPAIVLDPDGVADGVARNLVIATGHDGRTAWRSVNTGTRGVCKNTVEWAMEDRHRVVTIRHTSQIDVPTIDVKHTLGVVLTADEKFQEIAYQMLGADASWATVERMADKLWPRKDGESDRVKNKRDARLTTLQGLWESPKNSGGVGSNNWAVFNTFSEYLEHHAPTRLDRNERAISQGRLGNNLHRIARELVAG